MTKFLQCHCQPGALGNKIKLIENDELLQDDKNIAEEMNNFFKNAVLTLDIKENSYITNHNIPYITDPIEKTIEKYKFHPSIFLTKGYIRYKRLRLHIAMDIAYEI